LLEIEGVELSVFLLNLVKIVLVLSITLDFENKNFKIFVPFILKRLIFFEFLMHARLGGYMKIL
jgi:hypothetical protein